MVERDRPLPRRCCASGRRRSGCAPIPEMQALAEEELARLARGAARGRAGGAAGAAAQGRRRRAVGDPRDPRRHRRRGGGALRGGPGADVPAAGRGARAGAGRWSRRRRPSSAAIASWWRRSSGRGVFAALKFESGVHRVQRVPATESGGRIHTSAATVAVLPEAEEVDIDIPAQDIRIDTMRASGAGGQHVNTTDSAVRITHLPTGIVVTSLGEVAAPEPRPGHAGAAGAALRPRAAAARRRARGRPQGAGRLAATARSGSAPTTSRRAG